MIRKLFAAFALLVFCSCAATIKTPATFKFFEIEADRDVVLILVCEGHEAYKIKLQKSVPLELGGPEIHCTLVTEDGGDLSIEPVWE